MEDNFSFEAALSERDFSQQVEQLSPKRMLAYQIAREMARQKISRVEMAAKMKTSRAALNRLLDTENNSVTLRTIEAAAEILDLEIVITLKSREVK